MTLCHGLLLGVRIEQTISLTFDELATKLLKSIAEVINSRPKSGFIVDYITP